MKEVISIGIGSSGVKILDTIISQISLEHNIICPNSNSSPNGNYRQNFHEFENGKIQARAVFVDHESEPLDSTLKGPNGYLYNKNSSIIKGIESSSSNYYSSRYTTGRNLVDEASDSLRKEAEKSESLDGFHLHNSTVGGSAGLADLLRERISIDYGKKLKFSFIEWPSPNHSNLVVGDLNAI